MPHLFKRVAVAAATTAAALTVPIVGSGARAWAAMPASITVTGYGYGHGNGMGQYGAYGYAANGWSYQQILGQYYGGTTLTSSPSSPTLPANMSAHLVELDNANTVTVTAASGTVLVNGVDTKKPSATLTRGQTATASGNADLVLSAQWWGTSGPATRYFPGSISLPNNTNQVLNTVTLDQYVEGVVPGEMPASWSAEALKAQAVAARSYALAYEQRGSYNSICDYAACQMYVGDPAKNPDYGSYAQNSNAAVTATSGQVLVCGNTAACGNPGQVAFTEYSASTGGYTAGGDGFPAVPDAGDGEVPGGNPFHPWTTTVARSSVERAYPSIGTLQSIQITQRNNLGTWGGRVVTIKLIGSSATATDSGAGFANNLGLYSDWFNIAVNPAAGTDTGYWVAGSDGSVFSYGTAPSFPLLPSNYYTAPVTGLAPTVTDDGFWLTSANGGIFSFGNASFHGSAGRLKLGSPIVAIASSHDSGGYWQAAAGGGIFNYGDAGFYGAASSYHPASPVVAIVPSATGNGYWEMTKAGGIYSFGDAQFFGAATPYNIGNTAVGMQRSPTGNGYWIYTSRGGVFTFGDAQFGGSLAPAGQTNFIGAIATPDQGGYVMLTSAGVAKTVGDATAFGDPADNAPNWTGQVVGIYGL